VVRVDSNSHRSKQISFFFSRFFCFLSFCFFCFFSRFLFFFFANMTMRTDCPTHTIHRQPTNAAETATKKSKNYHCKLYFDIPVKDDTKKPKNKQTRKREREIGLGRGSVWFSPPPYKRVKFTTKKEKKKRSNRDPIVCKSYDKKIRVFDSYCVPSCKNGCVFEQELPYGYERGKAMKNMLQFFRQDCEGRKHYLTIPKEWKESTGVWYSSGDDEAEEEDEESFDLASASVFDPENGRRL